MPDRLHQDAAFWAGLFEREHQRLCAVALAWLGNLDDSLDIVQDVLVKLVQRGAHIDEPMGYCLRSIRNAAIDELRRRQRLPDHEPLAPDCGNLIDLDACRDAEQRQTAQLVRDALTRIGTVQREVIALKIYGGLTLAQIADTLDIPAGTAATHYRRGLEALRDLLRRQIDDAA